jgi:hypothetical protein
LIQLLLCEPLKWRFKRKSPNTSCDNCNLKLWTYVYQLTNCRGEWILTCKVTNRMCIITIQNEVKDKFLQH